MNNTADKWRELNKKIIDSLDLHTEFSALGLKFAGEERSSGWCSCYAIGRDDKSPSAAVYLGDGTLRGRYIDKGGDGESIGFFDFAARYGNFSDWREARKHYGKITKLSRSFPKTKDQEKVNEDKLDPLWVSFQQFGLMTSGLVKRYPGITVAAMIRNSIYRGTGASREVKIARYPKGAPEQDYCVVLPAYGRDGILAGPTGYVLLPVSGGRIKIYKGKDENGIENPPDWVKSVSLGRGMLGRWGVRHLSQCDRAYKVEGVTDLLSLQSIIPQELLTRHVVLTNTDGAHAIDSPREFAPMFAGKDTFVIHDADEPGQNGAKVWVAYLAKICPSVTNTQLPYVVQPTKGKDLRDLINGRTDAI